MNRNEAYEAMVNGEKIRHKGWINGVHVLYRDGKFIYLNGKTEASVVDCMSLEFGYELYQEPKPVRKFEAWETKVNGIAHGTIELCFSDSESSLYNKEHSNAYRKLSESELKELIKGVIGE